MSKINQILANWIPNDIHTLRWFEQFEVSQRLAFQYSESGTLRRIGEGVFVRSNDELFWSAAVRAMQEELKLDIHVSGISALFLQGLSHQLLSGELIEITSYSRASLPIWVRKNDWGATLQLRQSKLFQVPLSYQDHESQGISFKIASRELAILEYIASSELRYSFSSIEDQLVSLRTMQNSVLQKLLEACRSVKTKRVFLYLSRELQMPFYDKLDLSHIDLGSGKRVIVESGKLDPEFQITVPRGNEENPF